MCDINTPRFDRVRDHIRTARRNGVDWNEPRLLVDEARLELLKETNYWPEELTSKLWLQIIDSEKYSELIREERVRLREAEANDAILGNVANIANGVEIPTLPTSCWQKFRRHILEQGSLDGDDVDELENSVWQTLRRLSTDTHGKPPVKGLVIGHVQSGKTTNIAALMNMAADWGFNLFIVLTGRIENLRKQTHQRLSSDLKPGNLFWVGLGKQPKPRSEDHQMATLSFGSESPQRYFTVVLKNQKRLENLRDWLQSCPQSLVKVKILIIDDESDEAGINTGNVEDAERSAINSLILEIVKTNAKAVNYVGYTATPYANVLNESPGPDTLYPSSFIRSLRVSNQYFGPKEIFGIEGVADADGMDIIREIAVPNLDAGENGQEGPHDERAVITDIQSGHRTDLIEAESLKKSIAWFLCATAVRRFLEHTKPSTMLIHTSQKQDHHQLLADAIYGWLNSTPPNQIINLCEDVWNEEVPRFSLERLRQQYPDYRLINEVKDYPVFAEIHSHIQELISVIRAIPIDENSQMPTYHKGIHLCIDNCAQNGVNDEGQHIRLLYPQPPPALQPDFCTAFIVVGGATLSRGLTLQGLVSTYFLRDSTLGDSLLQMGRWFGYRRGYELLPRIWMTQDTMEKFSWLAGVEQSLRDELKRYEVAGASPSEFGPRVKAHPVLSWLRITARNKMQRAVTVGWDFAGITNQTTMFKDDADWLEHNICTAEGFLSLLEVQPVLIRGGIVYRQVNFTQIAEFLMKMNFHPRNMVFKQKENFIKWFSEAQGDAGYTAWNVVVGGFDDALQNLPAGEDEINWWKVPGGFVKKVNRTRKGKLLADGSFSIGALLSPRDRLGDCECDIPPRTPSLPDVTKIRADLALSLTPLLVIYRVNKDSAYTGSRDDRHDLNSCRDLLGVTMIIPGEKEAGGLVRDVTVQIDPGDIEQADIED